MKRQIIIKGLLSLVIVACSDSSSETQAVRDRVRILGLEVQDDGLYRFKLCRVHQEYTAQILAEKCINPFVTADGQEKVFTAVPRKPSTAVAHIRNWGLASFIGITAGVVTYKLGRSIVKIRKARELVGDAMEGKIFGNIEKVLSGSDQKVVKIGDQEKEFLKKVSEDSDLKKRVFANKINDQEDIIRLMKAEELTQKKLAEMGDESAQLEVDELTISKESAEKELAKLKSQLKQLEGLDASEKITRERQRLQIDISRVQESVNSTRFKKIYDDYDSFTKEELEERVNLWRTKYSNDFDSKLAEVREAISFKPSTSVAEDVAKEDEAIKIEMKEYQRFDQKFLKKIGGGFELVAKKLKGFPYISEKTFKYPPTKVDKHDEVVKGIIDNRTSKEIAVGNRSPKAIGQVAGFGAFIALPLTAIARHLPGEALLSASNDWLAITSEISSKHSTTVRVEDIATILDGVAQATGCKVSNKARTFAL